MTIAIPINAATSGPAARAASQHDTIEVARVALVIGLVFLHYFTFPTDPRPPFQGIDPAEHHVATFINGFLTFFFFSAVPLLSAISGWLFFGFTGGDPGKAIGRRILGRARSLLLPLLIWNGLTLAFAVALQLGMPSLGLAQGFNLHVATAGPWDYVNAILGLTALPIAFQFWFVRDLFVTVLCTPLLWLALRHAPLTAAVALGLIWVCGFTLGIFIRTDVLFFFYLGALIRRRGIDTSIAPATAMVLLAAYSVLTAARSLAPLVVDMNDPTAAMWLDVATRLVRPLGVVACWGMCLHLASTGLGQRLTTLGGFAFFLHAAHFPVIAVVKDALWRLTPAETDAWLLVHYVGSVALTVAIVGVAAMVVFRLSPALYGVLAGGRKLAA